MQEKGCPPMEESTAVESAEKPRESRIPPAPVSMTIGSKSSSFRQSKSFCVKETMLPKPPSSHEISSRTAKSNGGSSRMEASAMAASVENGGRLLSKPNGASKVCDPAMAKPKQKDNGKSEPKADTLPLNSRSDRASSPREGGVLKSSSSKKMNAIISARQTSVKQPAPTAEAAAKMTRSKDSSSPPSGLANVKSLSMSLNADPQKKLPPIKTARLHGSGKSAMAKNAANLCAECRAELEGAVCFIGNDGRVSACTSRTAVRLCKNLKCANNKPEHVASVAAAIAAPKKYLVSRRHSLPSTGSKSSSKGGGSDKELAQKANQNSTTSMRDADADADASIVPHDIDAVEHESCEEFDMQGELEDDVASLDDMGEGVASASPHGGRLGFRPMRRRSFSVIERQGQEVVTLKKQMMQERRQAEEWMLDYAIEEALHRLAPSKDSKVKALVEAFESVIAPQDHCVDGPKTPIKNFV